MADRKAQTMQLSGNDYAKVAERLKLFRSDHPKSKIETDHSYLDDKSVEFKAWIWKDKTEYIELVKGGVSDREILRSTADADGDAKGEVGVKQKDFEKLQTIALGRALAMMGYLASGEIASSEEMEEFEKFREQQNAEQRAAVVEQIQATTNNLELNKVLAANSSLLKHQDIVAAAREKQAGFAAAKAAEKPAEGQDEAHADN
jgi:hypothetical protein